MNVYALVKNILKKTERERERKTIARPQGIMDVLK